MYIFLFSFLSSLNFIMKRKKKRKLKKELTTVNKLILIDLELVFDSNPKDSILEQTLLKKCLIKMIERVNIYFDQWGNFKKPNQFYVAHFKDKNYKTYTSQRLYFLITEMLKSHPSKRLSKVLKGAKEKYQTYKTLIYYRYINKSTRKNEEVLNIVKSALQIMKGAIESTLTINPKMKQKIYEFKKKELVNNPSIQSRFRLSIDEKYESMLNRIFKYYTKNLKKEKKILLNIKNKSIEEKTYLIRVITSQLHSMRKNQPEVIFYQTPFPLLISETGLKSFTN